METRIYLESAIVLWSIQDKNTQQPLNLTAFDNVSTKLRGYHYRDRRGILGYALRKHYYLSLISD